MIRRGVRHGLKIEYVLFDSWFTCSKLVNEIRGIGKLNHHVVALHKMNNQRFTVDGKLRHIQDLIALNERNAKPCRKMKAVYFTLRGDMGGIPVKMFFVRYGRQDSWRLLIELRADITGLGVDEIMEMILQDEKKATIYTERCYLIEKQRTAQTKIVTLTYSLIFIQC